MNSTPLKHAVVSCVALVALLSTAACVRAQNPPPFQAQYNRLTRLFKDWRVFQKPPLVDGVPDYSARSMEEQHRRLGDFRTLLAAIDTTAWPVSARVDYRIVEAEMNGLDFDHRIRRPWERDPAFYVMIYPSRTDVPAREGPVIEGAIELWSFELPLSEERARELARRMRNIRPLYERAQTILTGNAADLWTSGIRRLEKQPSDLRAFASRLGDQRTELADAVSDAASATETFIAWLKDLAPAKTGPSGVGADNYTWYQKNVHLVPYSWEEEVVLVRRELARALSALRLDEHRNRHLAPLDPVESAEEYERRFREAVDEYMLFLDQGDILTVRDYMKPALLARLGRYVRAESARGFFTQVNYRDLLVMRTHHFHWFDLAQMEIDPHPSPIRRRPLLYNIYDSRAEGLATGMEEMMMNAGLFEGHSRARELVFVLLAQRAARALAGLYMHANRFTMEEAVAFASRWTPRGWMPPDGNTVRGEQHLYLQQPGYGTSYVIGKLQIEELIAERSLQLGDRFSLKAFMDTFVGAGVIPVSLIRWEMTGHGTDTPAMGGSE